MLTIPAKRTWIERYGFVTGCLAGVAWWALSLSASDQLFLFLIFAGMVLGFARRATGESQLAWILCAVMTSVVGVSIAAWGTLSVGSVLSSGTFGGIAVPLAAAVLAYLWFVWVCVVAARWMLSQRWSDPNCPGCGHDLQGLSGSTCPECGRARAKEPSPIHD